MQKKITMQRRMQQTAHHIFAVILFASLLISAFSCSNDPEEVRKMTKHDTLPQQQAEDVVMYYSEHGEVVFELLSPKIESYEEDPPRTVFPKGFEVVFYDSTGNNIRSRLTANYGVKNDKSKIMTARGNVVINNYEKNERLNTEELIWNQRQKRIYTNKFVTITTDEQVFYGEGGMESDESFNSWTIKKLSGKMKIEEE